MQLARPIDHHAEGRVFRENGGALKEKTASVTSSCRWPGFAARGRPMTTSHRGSSLAELRIATRHLLNRSGLQSDCTGVGGTTNRRVWEHDDAFKACRGTRAQAIDMETATLFSVGFANRLSVGALLLGGDEPMTPSGVKTDASDAKVTASFVDEHIRIGIDSLKEIQSEGRSIKHLKWR